MSLIINADDFGLNEQINRAIILSFKKGLCSSTTLMPNMPGFEEACQLSHENKLINHIGIHLVLRDGYPLTETIKHFPRFCDKEGRLCLSQARPTLNLETSEKEILAEEIRAQVKRCRDYGIPITHLDSHHGIHNQWGIATVLIPIIHEQEIPYIRISRNCGSNLGFLKRLYKYIFNRKLRLKNLTRTKYYGSIENYIHLRRHMRVVETIKSFEVMIHPIFSDKQLLIDATNNKPLEEVIKVIDSYKNAVSFSGAKYL